MSPVDDGEYVKYEDYALLLNDYLRLKHGEPMEINTEYANDLPVRRIPEQYKTPAERLEQFRKGNGCNCS